MATASAELTPDSFMQSQGAPGQSKDLTPDDFMQQQAKPALPPEAQSQIDAAIKTVPQPKPPQMQSVPLLDQPQGTSYKAMDPKADAAYQQQEAQKFTEEIGAAVPDAAVKPLAAVTHKAIEPFNKYVGGVGEEMGSLAEHIATGTPEAPTGSEASPGALAFRQQHGIPAITPEQEQQRIGEARKQHPLVTGIARSVGQLAGQTAADPRQWPLLFTGSAELKPLFAKLMSGGFAVQMGTDAAENSNDLINNWDKYTPDQRVEKIASTGLTSLFAAMATAHAASPHGAPGHEASKEPPVQEPARQVAPPATGEAVAQPSGAVEKPVQAAENLNPDTFMQEEANAVRPGDAQVQARPTPVVERGESQRPQAGSSHLPEREGGSGAGEPGVPAGTEAGRPVPKVTKTRLQTAKDIDRVGSGKVAATELTEGYEPKVEKGSKPRYQIAQLEDGRRVAYNPSKTNEQTVKEHAAKNELYKLTGDQPPESKRAEASAAATGRDGQDTVAESSEGDNTERTEPNVSKDVILARHGETKLDQKGAKDTVAGWTAEPLDERGKKSAAAMAEELKPEPVSHIVTSDLERAKQTANIVGDKLGVPVTEDSRLRPQHTPETEGKQMGEAKPIHDYYVEHPDERPNGGETYNETLARQRAAISDAKAGSENGEKPVVLTHSRNIEAELGTTPEPGGVVIGDRTAKPRTPGEPLEHGFDFRPAEDKGQQARDAVQKTQGALPRGERRKIERTPDEQATQKYFAQARKELGEDASSDQVMARVGELKKVPAQTENGPVSFRGSMWEHKGGQFLKDGKVLDKSDDIADALAALSQKDYFGGKTIEGELKKEPPTRIEQARAVDIAKRIQSTPGPEPGDVGKMKVSDLRLAPQKFQYKLGADAAGTSTLLKETRVFNPDLAGTISVWRDPADGKMYVVNGHHRYELARRTGQKDIAVRHIVAGDASEARAVGARQNIGEGRGTAVDAAKFFRETSVTPSDLEKHGISLGEATAKDGLSLSRLDQSIFNRVVSGDLRQGRAKAIGEATDDPAEQKAILSLVERKERAGAKVSDDTLAELIRLVKGSEQTTETTADLFGTQEINRSLALEKAEISAHIKQQLSKDKKLFGFVAKEGRATELARAGNKIDVERSQDISTGAAQAEEVYNKLSERGGSISSILDESARRLAKGENGATVKADAYQRVRAEVSQTLGGEEGKVSPRLEAGAGRSQEAESKVDPTLPGMESVPRERAEANAEQQGKDLTAKLTEPPKSIESKVGEIEQKSPLFRDSEANPQKGLFAEENPRVVPGARSARTGNETGTTSIQDLTDSIRRQVPDKRPLKDRLNRGAQIGEQMESAKDSVSRTYARIKGAASALWDAVSRPAPYTQYEDATGKWQGADQINAHDLMGFTEAIKKAVPEKLHREAISNWIEAAGDDAILRERTAKSQAAYRKGYEQALKLTDAEKTIARNVMNRNDATLEEAQKAGILQQGVENYVRHVYADDPKMQAKVNAEMNFNSLKTKPSFTKERKIPTYFDAEQLGFTPKDKDVGYLTAIHERSFREALAARAYIRSLMEGKAEDGRPLVQTAWSSAKEIEAKDGESSAAYLVKPNIKAEEEYADYRRIDHPALRGWRWAGKTDSGEPIFVQGDALVHPEIYAKLRNNLGRSAIRSYEMTVAGRTFHPGAAVLNVSSQVKHAILSFSGFHQTTLGMHALEHRTLPAGMPDLDLGDAKQRSLVEHGLMVAQYDAEEAFGEGVASGGIVTKVPGIGPLYGHYVNYLFHDYLPRVKMAVALNALDRNFERYGEKLKSGKITEDQVYRITSEQANAAFGGLNYRMLGRNKTMQDVLRLGLMAPDFFEARARYTGQAAKPYGREQTVALLGGAVVLYTLGRLLNQALDDDPHWDKPFAIVHKGREYAMRTIQQDIFNALTDPAKYFMARLSPLVSTSIHLGEGRNQFGRKQSLGQAVKETAKSEVPIPLQPWVRKSHDSNAQKAIESIGKMVGVNVKKAEHHHRRGRVRLH